MAKRELSSTLKNLKFMQRASQREVKPKKDEDVITDGNFPSSSTPKRCVVIMEGDPHPGASKGRMSFQSFNPSIEKLNEETISFRQPDAAATSSGNQSGRNFDRENGSIEDGSDSLRFDSFEKDDNGDPKRKQAEVTSESIYPNKSPKNHHGDQKCSPSSSRSSRKQQKGENLDWNVLRPSKCQNKRG